MCHKTVWLFFMALRRQVKGLVFPVTPAAQREGWDSGRREQMNGREGV